MGMTNTALSALATEIAARHEVSITRAYDGATFTYRPEVCVRTENDYTGAPKATRVVVSVPVNAVLSAPAALAMINAFRRELVAAVGDSAKLTARTVKARGGGRTSVHVSGYVHMGAFHTDGLWISLSVEA